MNFEHPYRIRIAACAAVGLALVLATHALQAQGTKENVTVDGVDRELKVRLPDISSGV
jgi:hypothetical protein